MPDKDNGDIRTWLSRIANDTIVWVALLTSVKIVEIFEKLLWPEGNSFVSILVWLGYAYLLYLALSYIFVHGREYLSRKKD